MPNPIRTGDRNRQTKDHMSSKDLLMWRLEKDPRVHPVIVLLVVLDDTVDLSALYAWHRQAAHFVPRMAGRVVTPRNPFAAPYWVSDELFDPAQHIRRLTLEGKGTEEDLFALVESLTPLPFVPRRAPWDAYLIDGLEGGRTAYLLKISHTIVDGMRLRDMFLRQPPTVVPPAAVTDAARPAEGSATTATARPARRAGRTRRTSRVRRWGAWARLAAEITQQVVHRPQLPPAHGDGVSRRYTGLDVPVAALRAAGAEGGGNEQDALVAAVTAGCHRYYRSAGVDRPKFYTLAPYARAPLTRQDPNPVGNHWFVIRMGLPAAGAWTDRVRAARRGAIRAYHPNAPDWFGAGAQAIRVAPGAWFPSVFHRFCATFDFLSTSIPGPRRAAVLAGTPVAKVYGIAPTLGSGATVTTVTYAGRCHLTLTVDPSVVPDPDGLAQHIRRSVMEAVGLDESPGAAAAGTDRPVSGGPARAVD